jgi:hypothetical protein
MAPKSDTKKGKITVPSPLAEVGRIPLKRNLACGEFNLEGILL